MKTRGLLLTIFLLTPLAAWADNYQVTFGWTDPTSYLPSDEPVYGAKYRIAGGAEVLIENLATPGGAVNITASPGDLVEFAAQACNLGLCSPWTAWAAVTAPYPPTQPGGQNGLTVTITRVD